jgi:hypothetical protein
VLEPVSADSSHPYPVELDLPPWTVAADVDLRSWLFAFGGGIRIESPDVLRQELVQRSREAMEANEEQHLKPPTPVEQFSPSRLRRD